jgi:hypothetical protein
VIEGPGGLADVVPTTQKSVPYPRAESDIPENSLPASSQHRRRKFFTTLLQSNID